MMSSILSTILLSLPLTGDDYETLFYGMIFVCVFTLLFIIVYLMVGEEREEAET